MKFKRNLKKNKNLQKMHIIAVNYENLKKKNKTQINPLKKTL